MASEAPQNSPPIPFPDEATSHVLDTSATRDVIAAWLERLRLPPISGAECVRALHRAGYRLRTVAAGCAAVQRDGDTVDVPLIDRLTPDVLAAILAKARLGPVAFLEALGE
jgi:hypothetical protein